MLKLFEPPAITPAAHEPQSGAQALVPALAECATNLDACLDLSRRAEDELLQDFLSIAEEVASLARLGGQAAPAQQTVAGMADCAGRLTEQVHRAIVNLQAYDRISQSIASNAEWLRGLSQFLGSAPAGELRVGMTRPITHVASDGEGSVDLF